MRWKTKGLMKNIFMPHPTSADHSIPSSPKKILGKATMMPWRTRKKGRLGGRMKRKRRCSELTQHSLSRYFGTTSLFFKTNFKTWCYLEGPWQSCISEKNIHKYPKNLSHLVTKNYREDIFKICQI